MRGEVALPVAMGNNVSLGMRSMARDEEARSGISGHITA